MKNNLAYKQIKLPKGTLIKIKGIPFELKEETTCETGLENYKLSFNHLEQLLSNPVQAPSPDNFTTNKLSEESIKDFR